jgi:hypothetical protein
MMGYFTMHKNAYLNCCSSYDKINKGIYRVCFEVVLSTTRMVIKNLAYAFEVVLSTTRVVIKNLAYAFEVVLSTTRVVIKNF